MDVSQQKRDLNSTLGLEHVGGMEEMISEEDLHTPAAAPLSARELAQLKRKAKRQPMPPEKKSCVSTEPEIPKSTPSIRSDWPLETLWFTCKQMLLDNCWYRRHGACLAITALLSSIPAECLPSIDHRNELASLLLQLLVRDRVTDFTADQAAIPVRVACCEALAVLKPAIGNLLIELLSAFLFLDWQVAISCLSCIRLCSDTAIEKVFVLEQCLLVPDDDVKACATEILLGEGCKVSTKTLQTLIQLLQSEEQSLEEGSVERFLRLLYLQKATVPIEAVIKWLRSPNQSIRAHCLELIGENFLCLVEFLLLEQDRSLQLRAATLIGECKDPAQLEESFFSWLPNSLAVDQPLPKFLFSSCVPSEYDSLFTRGDVQMLHKRESLLFQRFLLLRAIASFDFSFLSEDSLVFWILRYFSQHPPDSIPALPPCSNYQDEITLFKIFLIARYQTQSIIGWHIAFLLNSIPIANSFVAEFILPVELLRILNFKKNEKLLNAVLITVANSDHCNCAILQRQLLTLGERELFFNFLVPELEKGESRGELLSSLLVYCNLKGASLAKSQPNVVLLVFALIEKHPLATDCFASLMAADWSAFWWLFSGKFDRLKGVSSTTLLSLTSKYLSLIGSKEDHSNFLIVFLIRPTLRAINEIASLSEVRSAYESFAQLLLLYQVHSDSPKDLEIIRKTEGLFELLQLERSFIDDFLDPRRIAKSSVSLTALSTSLRPYQIEGVNWMRFLAKYHLNGALCDDMGLGKTLQTLTSIYLSYIENDDHLPSLIICPSSLQEHWLREVKNHFSKTADCSLLEAAIVNSNFSVKNFSLFNLFIVSYDFLRSSSPLISFIQGKQSWLWCVLDEGHVIRNSKTKIAIACKGIRAKHRLLLTGTPIQNSITELWSLFDFLMPGYLGDEAAFNDRYVRPLQHSKEARSGSREYEAGEHALRSLHQQTLPFILRRLKETVLKDLPEKTIQDVVVELTPKQRSLYNSIIANMSDNNISNILTDNSFQLISYLQKLVLHPSLIVDDYQSENWLEESPKLQALLELLNEALLPIDDLQLPHRVLIFAQRKSTLDLIERLVLSPSFSPTIWTRLDGSVPVCLRVPLADKFNKDPTLRILLLTTGIGGLGLDLTGADVVIMVEHDWNPMKDLQAMDRAHRLGQRRSVSVYRLIVADTIEEKIMGEQSFKRYVAGSVVDQQNSTMTEWSGAGVDPGELFRDAAASSSEAAAVAPEKRLTLKEMLEKIQSEQPDQ